MRATDDTGSAIAEFVMVSALLTVLTLSVLQLGLTLLVRNTVLDAAAEGGPPCSCSKTVGFCADTVGLRQRLWQQHPKPAPTRGAPTYATWTATPYRCK